MRGKAIALPGYHLITIFISDSVFKWHATHGGRAKPGDRTAQSCSYLGGSIQKDMDLRNHLGVTSLHQPLKQASETHIPYLEIETSWRRNRGTDNPRFQEFSRHGRRRCPFQMPEELISVHLDIMDVVIIKKTCLIYLQEKDGITRTQKEILLGERRQI
jgi:hypothetical protein